MNNNTELLPYREAIIINIIIASTMLFPNLVYSQNLIPNPSFANITRCVSLISDFEDKNIEAAPPWKQAGYGSSDLRSNCAGYLTSTYLRNCPPKSGQKTAGILLFGYKAGINDVTHDCYNSNYIEYIEVKLLDTLKGKRNPFIVQGCIKVISGASVRLCLF